MTRFTLSSFGARYAGHTGISELMTDISAPPTDASQPLCMLGGGNPAIIPELSEAWAEATRATLEDSGFRRLVGAYDSHIGPEGFRDALAECFGNDYGWPISRRNVGLVNGSQLAVFYLVNMFSGAFPDGSRKRILLPLAPEYVGYADQGLDPDCFRSQRPTIEMLGAHSFKYLVDFSALRTDESTGALLVSRPTNPSGNVVTDAEVLHLAAMAREAGVPLILDNAYGLPFPGILFAEATPIWNEDIILCMSLSKIGLPALRTGIVIAHEDVIDALAATNAIVSLATGSVGPAVAERLLRSGELLRLSREVVQPCYRAKSLRAQQIIAEALGEMPWALHASEGAIFLWLWLRDLPVPTRELYRRLKARNVLVLPGEHFFFGLEEDWPHARECLRLNYAGDETLFARGVGILAEELRALYG